MEFPTRTCSKCRWFAGLAVVVACFAANALIPNASSRWATIARSSSSGWPSHTIAISQGTNHSQIHVEKVSDRFSKTCPLTPVSLAAFKHYSEFHRKCRNNATCMARAVIWECQDNGDCKGLGDQLRGLAFVFFAALATERPFFVRYARRGVDLLDDIFKVNWIDTRLPASFRSPCTTKVMIAHKNKSEVLGLLGWLRSPEQRCIILHTNIPVV